jgi:hypothetical protein
VLRFLRIAFSRLRSEGFTVMDIPVRIPQTRTSGASRESHSGFKCQTGSTRTLNIHAPQHVPAVSHYSSGWAN